MRRSRNILTLLRIQFEWANQKKQIFGRYQSYKRRNLKKPRSSGDENGTAVESKGVSTHGRGHFFVPPVSSANTKKKGPLLARKAAIFVDSVTFFKYTLPFYREMWYSNILGRV